MGRTIIQLAVDDHTLDTLMSFDVDELEDQGDQEPDDDAEADWLPLVLLDVVRPKVIKRRRAPSLASGCVD